MRTRRIHTDPSFHTEPGFHPEPVETCPMAG